MKKVVIIGGGFSGIHTAKKLEGKFDVTLIDSKNYFEFTPGILRTIVEPEHIKKIQVLHENYLRKTRIIVGEVSNIDLKSAYVGKKRYDYDYLVICSGSSYNYPIKEEAVVLAHRSKHLIDSHKHLEKAKSVLVIGGGLVGVELSAEIAKKYPGKKITIVHSHNRLIERNSFKASKYAERFLKKKGVEIIYQERIEKKKGKTFATDKKRKIKADIVFICTGIKPNFDFIKKSLSYLLDEKNHVIVNEYLQANNLKNVFSAGDVNNAGVEKTAQNSEIQAYIAAKNIIALEKGRELKAYKGRKTPMVISLGKYAGIFDHKGFVLTGIIPGLMKTFIEKREMFKVKYVFRWLGAPGFCGFKDK